MIALLGGTAATVAVMGNIGAPTGACDIPLTVMNEAFDSSTSFQATDLAVPGRLPPEVRCFYNQGSRAEYDDGVVEVSVLRQQPPDPMHLSMLQSAAGLSGGARGEGSSVPIVMTSGDEGKNGGGYMLCIVDDALWMITVEDDPS